jgi:hypothetical protein
MGLSRDNGGLEVHSSLLNMVLHETPGITKGSDGAKAVPAKRYASTIGFSRKSSPTTSKPNRGRTEMASLLQRAFSGY